MSSDEMQWNKLTFLLFGSPHLILPMFANAWTVLQFNGPESPSNSCSFRIVRFSSPIGTIDVIFNVIHLERSIMALTLDS